MTRQTDKTVEKLIPLRIRARAAELARAGLDYSMALARASGEDRIAQWDASKTETHRANTAAMVAMYEEILEEMGPPDRGRGEGVAT